MLRTRSSLICLTAVALSLAGIALAKAVQQNLVAIDDDSDTGGHAILNFNKGKDMTEVQMNCWGLKAKTEYTVLLCPCDNPGDFIEIGSFTTNKHGKGKLHVRMEGDVSNLCVLVAEKDSSGNQAAGTRVRKQMQKVKQAAQLVRNSVLEIRSGEEISVGKVTITVKPEV